MISDPFNQSLFQCPRWIDCLFALFSIANKDFKDFSFNLLDPDTCKIVQLEIFFQEVSVIGSFIQKAVDKVGSFVREPWSRS